MGVSTGALLKVFRKLRGLATTPEREQLLKDAWPGIKQEMYLKDPKRVYLAGSGASKKPDPGDLDLVFYQKPQFEPGYMEVARPMRPPKEVAAKMRTTPQLPWEEVEKKLAEGKARGYYPDVQYPVHTIAKGRTSREYVEAMKGDPLAYQPQDIRRVMKRGRMDLRWMLKEGRERYGKDHKWIRLLGAAPLAAALGDEEDE